MSALLLLVPAGVVLFVADPAVTRVWPECPFHLLTGWLCPLCGSLRAAHLALHGQLAQAFQSNALTMGAALWGAVAVGRSRLDRARRAGTWPGPWTVCAVAALFTAARNVPGHVFWWLRP